jgi:hypothetical protein
MANFTKFFILAAVAVMMFSPAAFSQDKAPLEAADTSIKQTQTWLAKTINKNSTYHSGKNTTDSISDVKFDGCKLSYKIDRETKHDVTNEPFRGGAEGVSTTDPSTLFTALSTTLTLNLTEVNINGIKLVPLASSTNMQILSLPILNGAKGVGYEVRGSSPQMRASGSQAMAMMVIKSDVAEKVKTELVKAISLCQKPN